VSLWAWLKNLLLQLLAYLRGEHVIITIKPRENSMGTQHLVKAWPKGHKKAAATQQVTITDPSDTIQIQVVDASGTPIPGFDPSTVTSTFVSDTPAVFAITAGADSLHYSASIPAATPQGTVTNETATVTFVAGAPGPFSATVQTTINLPVPPPPTPAGINVVITGA